MKKKYANIKDQWNIIVNRNRNMFREEENTALTDGISSRAVAATAERTTIMRVFEEVSIWK